MMSEWKPIETAPKGQLIDIWTEGFASEGKRYVNCYYDAICDEWRTTYPRNILICIKAKYCTHWMPPPSPPQDKP